MNSILIIVEGLTDKGFIEGIAEKLQVACKIHVMRGNRPEKVSRLLRTLAGEFNKAIILKDLHRAGVDTSILINRLMSKVKQLESQEMQTRVFPVKRSIEAWILAGLSLNNPEETLNPEEELKKLMQRRSKQCIKSLELYKRLAKEEVDIEKAAAKSKTFKEFIEFLTA
jgi:hypothetical protein